MVPHPPSKEVSMNILFGAVPVLAAVMAMSSGPPTMDTVAPECEVAAAWVQENLDNLPSSFSEFAELPLAYRKAVYRVLDSETRADFWTEHFSSFLASSGNLGVEQLALLQVLTDDVDYYLSLTP
jgi:hypothetical protein